MLKIAIAEDDKLLRNGLKKIIEDNILDVSIVIEASNGLNILKFLETQTIDLLISDIKMPVIDGINLVKAIKEKGIKTKIIVVSGFSEYKYLRETMKNGVQDYLLKPVDKDELIALIDRIRTEISTETINQGISKAFIEEVYTDSFLQRESFLYNLVKNADFISKVNMEMSGSFHNITHCLVGIAQADGIKNEFEVNEIFKYLRNSFYHEFNLVSFVDNRKLIILFLFNYQTEENMDKKVQEIFAIVNQKLSKEMKETVSMGYGDYVRDINQLYKSYSQAIRTEEQLFYSNNASVIAYEPINFRVISAIDSNVLRDRIFAFVKNGDIVNLKESIKRFFFECTNKHIKPKEVREFWIVAYGNIFGKTEQQQTSNESVIDKILHSSNLQSLEKCIIDEFRDIVIQKYPAVNVEKSVIEKSKEYIVNNYQNDISLKDIANLVNLNSTYFSELFKKETGQKFVDYLIETRIDKAKRILVNEPGIFVNEIARMVGYTEPVSFNRAFKKLVGCTPISYRIRNR